MVFSVAIYVSMQLVMELLLPGKRSFGGKVVAVDKSARGALWRKDSSAREVSFGPTSKTAALIQSLQNENSRAIANTADDMSELNTEMAYYKKESDPKK